MYIMTLQCDIYLTSVSCPVSDNIAHLGEHSIQTDNCQNPSSQLTRPMLLQILSHVGKPIAHNTRSSLMSAESYSVIQKDCQCQPSVDLLLIMRDRQSGYKQKELCYNCPTCGNLDHWITPGLKCRENHSTSVTSHYSQLARSSPHSTATQDSPRIAFNSYDVHQYDVRF